MALHAVQMRDRDALPPTRTSITARFAARPAISRPPASDLPIPP
ncbi:MAG: hypothetical protein ACM3N4_12005 [Nitrososphaerota archaeon]